ncbi:thiamine phosphate synthase [Paenibacillus sacheonensis]|uniref:Thiamine-phosphate synthase n=1 Tax=Paenibacillus sacheonensis TaxID=742054 RepID=A0A7X5BYP9_9BACL|nr:thiamine phosphate synthase [Paenibacillus sacheonensis]MBM7568179.1 thiamine-phosphate pyrophosphorylase [Paenibacillus sacheonensis]NBC71823.1 thiamine phosphate synthase [Paenibacillus sacheonensis]
MKDFRLYAITGENFHPDRELLEVMEEAIHGGADIIQLRDKTSGREELLRKARALRDLTRRYGVTFIVNDHVDVAMEVDADGIHLGQGDLSLLEARRIVGDKIIGISTHALEEALLAEEQGADYIGVGPVYRTATKADVVDPVGVSYVREVAQHIKIPFVAIGGIKLSNVDEVIEAGATRICAVSEIVGSSDVKGTCEAFLSKLDKQG